MAVFQTSGVSISINENAPGYFSADTTNNITGGQGAKYLRILNPQAVLIMASWTLDSQVYNYTELDGTGGTGTGARFNVAITGNGVGGCTLIITQFNSETYPAGGTGYEVGDTLSLNGDNFGQVSQTVTLDVDTVDEETGAILTFTVNPYSAPYWPPYQATPTGTTYVLPTNEVTVQAQPGGTNPTGITLTTIGAGSDNTIVEVVTVVG